MNCLPILETPTENFIKDNSFHSASWEDIKKLYSIINECVTGSCCAIKINDEIIYNAYNHRRLNSEIIYEETVREQFARTPQYIIRPSDHLDINIYMFYTHPWRLHVTYSDFQYYIHCFN